MNKEEYYVKFGKMGSADSSIIISDGEKEVELFIEEQSWKVAGHFIDLCRCLIAGYSPNHFGSWKRLIIAPNELINKFIEKNIAKLSGNFKCNICNCNLMCKDDIGEHVITEHSNELFADWKWTGYAGRHNDDILEGDRVRFPYHGKDGGWIEEGTIVYDLKWSIKTDNGEILDLGEFFDRCDIIGTIHDK